MTAQPERAIRSIFICGSGVVGWSAAVAFARALPQARISVLALPEDPAALAERVPATLPAVGRFHAAARVDELDLVRCGAAVHHLGTLFENWSRGGEPWIHAHGQYGVPEWPVVFHDLWARSREAGRALPYHRYSAAGVMADAAKFVHPRQDGRWPFSSYRYGLRLDPAPYRAHLEQQATEAGVSLLDGRLSGVDRNADGRLDAITINGGARIEADLFIDCSGPEALLIREVDDRFESWAELFPCHRLSFVWTTADVSPADRVIASPTGWTWMQPLAQRTLVVDGRSDGKAAEQVEGEPVAVRYGRRPNGWVRNVLALGDAAVTVDPLHGGNLHLAHSAILRALELLPGRDCHPIELREYNRRADQELSRVRDFLALHYLRSGRTDGDLWRRSAGTASPESLAHTLDQFETRGRLPFYEQESFTPDSWSAALLGLGVLPRHPDAVAGKFPFEESVASMDRLAERLQELPDQLPPYGDYLQRMIGGGPAAAPQ